jgi:hypothetical protein
MQAGKFNDYDNVAKQGTEVDDGVFKVGVGGDHG